MIDKKLEPKGIKLIYGSQTKRINDKVGNFEILRKNTKDLFNFNEDELKKVRFFLIDKNSKIFDVKKEIQSDEDFYQIIQNIPNLNYCLKILIELEKQEYNSICFDDFSFLENSSKNENKEDKNTVKINSFKDDTNLMINRIENLMNSKFYELEDKINNKLENIILNSTHHTPNLQKQSSIIIEINGIERDKLIIKDNQNNLKLENSQLEYVDIKNNKNLNNSIFNEFCSMCSRNILYTKFTCCICSNMTICEKCENLHSHPLIKFKSTEFQTTEDIVYYMASHQKTSKGFLKKIQENLFEKKIKLKTFVHSNKITTRPNKKFNIPIIIYNEMKQIKQNIPIMIIVRNNKDLKINQFMIDYDLFNYSGERFEFLLNCESNDQIKIYDFEILLFSPNVKIECEILNMKVEVNLDEEEEKLNEFFAMYNKIYAIPKNEKEMIRNIITQKICEKHPYLIYNILLKYDWNFEEALDELTSDSLI